MIETNESTAVAIPMSSLHPAPWNPRSIKDERFQNLCRSLEADPAFLWRRPILAQADGTIYAGNMRFRAAQHLGFTEVPAIVEDIPDQLATERALRDNAQWGEWEEDDLAALLRELREEGSELDLLGFDDKELQQLLDRLGKEPGLTDPDDAPEPSEQPYVQRGDLWILGAHKVLCGDATDRADIARLMDGSLADLIWTDPPYGVSYVGGTAEHLTMTNDDLDVEALTALLRASLGSALRVTRPGAVWYVTAPHGPMGLAFSVVLAELGVWRHSLVWVKDSLVMGRMDYHYRHEPIYYGWSPGAAHHAVPTRDQDTVWEIPRPKRSQEHATMKPVELVSRAIENSSDAGELVLDPFGGSFTTLIACQMTGRRFVGLEIDARYAQVGIERWQNHTGQKAVRA